jgi:hypothetical protein
MAGKLKTLIGNHQWGRMDAIAAREAEKLA